MFKSWALSPLLQDISKHNPDLATAIDDREGHLWPDDVPKLIAIDPKLRILVICENGTAICSILELMGVVSTIMEGHHKLLKNIIRVSLCVPVTNN